MIKINRKMAFLFSFIGILATVGLLFYSFEVSRLVSLSPHEIPYWIPLLLLIFGYQIIRVLYNDTYIPLIYLTPILAEAVIISGILSRKTNKFYNVLTRRIIEVFNRKEKVEDKSVEIVRKRAGFILKNVFVSFSFLWLLLEFYQNIDAEASNRNIELILVGARELSGFIPLDYLVIQLGGLSLAFASVRAISLEISHLSNSERYEIAHQNFGELISGVVILTVGILFPLFQLGYTILRDALNLPAEAYAMVIVLISISTISSTKDIAVSFIIGTMGIIDLLLIVTFANIIGLEDELTILALIFLFALALYPLSVWLKRVILSIGQRIKRPLIEMNIIQID